MKGVFWGLSTIDLHFFTDHYPTENSKVKASKFNSYVGGPATNAAITFSHLGGNAQLVTAIGKNAFKSMIYEELEAYGISIYDIKISEKIDPIFASIITNEANGSRTIFSYQPKEAENQAEYLIENETNIALFDGFYMKSAIAAAKMCKDQGITTVFDGGSWKAGTDEILPYIDIAICSQDFFPPSINSSEEVTEYLLKKGVKKTAVTRGGKPVITNEGEMNFLIEVPKTEVRDTLGAGDILHGAFCYFYAKSQNFLLALEKAAQVASLSCKFPGPRQWKEQE